MTEISIPSHLVPQDILDRLRKIGVQIETERSGSSLGAGSLPVNEVGKELSCRSRSRCDETDGDAMTLAKKQAQHSSSTFHQKQQTTQQQSPTLLQHAGQNEPNDKTQLLSGSEPLGLPSESAPHPYLSRNAGNLCSMMSTQDTQCVVQCKSPLQSRNVHESQTRTQQENQSRTVPDSQTRTLSDSRAPSDSDIKLPTSSVTLSSVSQSSPSPPTSACHVGLSSSEDGLCRVLHSPMVCLSTDYATHSPKVLTPPETPDKDSTRKVKDVFTFDEFACIQEKLRQTCENLYQLQTAGMGPTMRHPSIPPYRGKDLPRSPNLLHPAVNRHSLAEKSVLPREVSSRLPQPRKRLHSDSALQRRSPVDSHWLTTNQSLSPQPKKKLSFDDAKLSPRSPSVQNSLQSARNTYAPSSPRHVMTSHCGTDSSDCRRPTMTVAGFCMEDGSNHGSPSQSLKQPFGAFQERASGSTNHSLKMGRMDSGYLGEDEEDALYFHANQLPCQDSSASKHFPQYHAKRKRAEFDLTDSGTDTSLFCSCGLMEEDFLQMAEGAYKRIRRLDSSPEDFERFRNELAQTNEMLHESINLIQSIRQICHRRKRLTW